MIPSTSLPADPCWLLETSLIDLTDRNLCKNNTNDGSNMEIKSFNVLPLLSAPQMSSQYMILLFQNTRALCNTTLVTV